MNLIVSGTDTSLLHLVNTQFLQSNHYDETEDSFDMLYEVCNICYALKVLVRLHYSPACLFRLRVISVHLYCFSNIPDIKFAVGGRVLPLQASDDAFEILKAVNLNQKGKELLESMEVVDEEELDKVNKKKRKKKRGGGK